MKLTDESVRDVLDLRKIQPLFRLYMYLDIFLHGVHGV